MDCGIDENPIDWDQSYITLIHLFWDCKFVKTFWQNVHYWLIQYQINHNTFY